MSGYRGDGYGQYGNVGDDDFRWGEGRDEPSRGAAEGNLMGRAEERVRGFFNRDEDDQDRDHRNLADDPRAVRAADEWRERHGREGYEGSYAQHDEPYRRYRERHVAQLDEDYAEYCREHGHEFSSAFENWRQGRRQNSGVVAMDEARGSPDAGSAGAVTAATASESDNESPNLLVDESSGVALGEGGSTPTRDRSKR
jgi:hypothetical protein